MSLYRLIGRFLRAHSSAYLGAGAMLASIAGLIVWVPRQIGHIVDGLAQHRLHGIELAQQLGLLVAAGIAVYFLRVGWRLRLFAAAYRLGVELRQRLYQRLALQGPRFFQTRRTGDLMALATNDIDAVEMAAGEAMLAGFDGSLTLVLVVGMMTLGVDWRLAVAALLPFPLMALAFWRISRHVHEAWATSLRSFGQLNDHVQETLSGVRTLRALGLEARSAAQFSGLTGAAADASFVAQRWEAAYEPAVGFTLAAATVLTLGVGGRLVWLGELSVGQLTSFSLYLGQLIWPMFAAGWVLSLIERGKAAWGRLQPVLDEALTVDDAGKVDAVLPGPLQADGVSYRYEGQARPALHDLSFTLPAGETLGLVGPTGAGKSTLLRLLLRHHAPEAGEVRWSGVPLGDYRLGALRSAIAWVPQEAFLFSATVAQNIALAKPDASRAEIEQAARVAAVHDDILRLPQGYDTPVGERGVTLSGGQRQRVAIARALLADAPLLLLDDALSAVDTDTEARILAHLREVRAGAAAQRPGPAGSPSEGAHAPSRRPHRTTIIVSHRLSAVVDADHTIVLRDGHVAEQGDHASLLAQGGWYARQWRYQQLEASLDADTADAPAATPPTAPAAGDLTHVR
jgi:ATP-binding cassette subfamily B protein/ATP-binding cassette subfamily C protein/ATP-binding cassette subfamily B multidrug efflux pump